MDFADQLRNESLSGHAHFHEFALGFDKQPSDSFFLFFEGEDDPIFYVGFLVERFAGRSYQEFICMGREQVLKAHELVERDGRAVGRALFFVDKDHTDFMGGANPSSASIYQTEYYSFENYLPCEEVIRRFWVERLRLRAGDARLTEWLGRFRLAHAAFLRHCKLLMGFVLIGRGIAGHPAVKLNLNNANFDRIFKLDATTGSVRWRPSGLRAFNAAVDTPAVSLSDVRRACYTYFLTSEPKTYVRGKYELWFLVKFLQLMSTALSDKAAASLLGTPRAKPVENLTYANSVALLSSLCPFPASLRAFVDKAVPEKRAA